MAVIIEECWYSETHSVLDSDGDTKRSIPADKDLNNPALTAVS